MTTEEAPQRPRETLPVPLFDGVVLAVRAQDGSIWLCLADLCDVLNLTLSPQRRRIQLDQRLHLRSFAVPRGNQVRTLDFLRNDDLPTWLMVVPARQIREEVRERFVYVQSYLTAAVVRAFGELVGLPMGPGQQIEDLAELDRIEPSFVTLEEFERRHGEAETRNETAHHRLEALLAELRQQVRDLAHEVHLRINTEQRGTIFYLQEAWAEAHAQRANVPVGKAKNECWKQLNAAFGVASYHDLPAARYDEIVRYLKDRYRELTGHDLEAGEQGRLF